MRRHQVIQRIFALVMLLIFTLSITPKKYWHDLVADHVDFYSFHTNDAVSVSQAGFNCHCEDLVVSVPFIDVSFELSFPSQSIYLEFIPAPYHFFFSNCNTTKDLRGPPCVA